MNSLDDSALDSHTHEACESIDAAIFSGDLLTDEAQVVQLEEYIARWRREIERSRTLDAAGMLDDLTDAINKAIREGGISFDRNLIVAANEVARDLRERAAKALDDQALLAEARAQRDLLSAARPGGGKRG